MRAVAAAAERPLSVCMVVPYDLAEEGGVKRHALHVAASLRRRGDEVTVIGPSTSRAEIEGVHGFPGVINIRGNGSDNRLGLLASPLKLAAFFERRKFDVVHVHEPLLPALAYWAVWLTPRAAHVCTFHGYAEHEGLGMRFGRQLAAPAVLPWFRRGIAVSNPAARFAEKVWRRPLALIPNGVPASVFRHAEPQSAGPLRLLFVGHWRDSRKGLVHLLDACDLLRQRGVPFLLDVVGDGGPQTPRRAPGVTFHGVVSSETVLAEHYRACDLFVAPATGQESFGIVLLEAMASGRPVVCSDIAGYHEVVAEEGACFVPPGNAGELAAAIETLARDAPRRRRMGLENRARAERYDWEVLTGRVRDEYLLARGRRGAAPDRSRS